MTDEAKKCFAWIQDKYNMNYNKAKDFVVSGYAANS